MGDFDVVVGRQASGDLGAGQYRVQNCKKIDGIRLQNRLQLEDEEADGSVPVLLHRP